MIVAAAALALSSAGCQSAKEVDTGGKKKEEVASTPVVSTPPATTAAPQAGSAAIGGKLSDDLAQLAEMPELTAEATPEELERRLDQSLDALTAMLEIISEYDSCDEMGIALSRFAEVNKKLIDRLEAVAKDRRTMQQFEQLIIRRGTRWLEKMAANLQRCIANPKVTSAMMEMQPKR